MTYEHAGPLSPSTAFLDVQRELLLTTTGTGGKIQHRFGKLKLCLGQHYKTVHWTFVLNIC